MPATRNTAYQFTETSSRIGQFGLLSPALPDDAMLRLARSTGSHATDHQPCLGPEDLFELTSFLDRAITSLVHQGLLFQRINRRAAIEQNRSEDASNPPLSSANTTGVFAMGLYLTLKSILI
jgi:hypothetical protein